MGRSYRCYDHRGHAGVFPLLDVNPILGRYLLPDDDYKGAGPVVVLGETLWRNRFGASPEILGKTVNLDQRAFTIVGVMPASFRIPVFGPRQEIFIPVTQDPVFSSFIPARQLRMFVLGRMNSGASVAQTQSQADAS